MKVQELKDKIDVKNDALNKKDMEKSKIFKCKECKEEFEDKINLSTHIKKYHPKKSSVTFVNLKDTFLVILMNIYSKLMGQRESSNAIVVRTHLCLKFDWKNMKRFINWMLVSTFAIISTIQKRVHMNFMGVNSDTLSPNHVDIVTNAEKVSVSLNITKI